MRVSANSDDADYFSLHFEGKVRIVLDGVDLRGVIEADDAAGYVVRMVRDPAGELLMAAEGVLATERLHGRVEIVGKPQVMRHRGQNGAS